MEEKTLQNETVVGGFRKEFSEALATFVKKSFSGSKPTSADGFWKSLELVRNILELNLLCQTKKAANFNNHPWTPGKYLFKF